MQAEHKKYVIVGAGPGGLQMGYFMQKAGLDYVILERNAMPGSFFAQYPVHRKLISLNKKNNYFEEEEFNWRHDWNSLLCEEPSPRFTEYTDDLFPHADLYTKYLADYARAHELNITFDTPVKRISKADGKFVLELASGSKMTCEVLLMATGAVSGSVPDNIEGIEHTVPYGEQSIDLEFYKNKRVGVLGGGNSAFETADYLAGTAAFVHVLTNKPLKMAWDTHFVGDLRAVNNNVLDMYQLKSLHAVISPKISRIEKRDDGTVMTHHSYDYPHSKRPGTLQLTREYDIIINCTGFKWAPVHLFDDEIRPATRLKDKYLLMTESWESTNVPNLFFVGGAMQSIDRKAASGFIHGFRYTVRSLYRLLQERFEGKSITSHTHDKFELDPFLDRMYNRFSTAAGLFQLFGFLGDLILFSEDMQGYEEIREIPVARIRKIIPQDRHALQFTLEFGFDKHQYKTALDFMGPSDPNDTPRAAFLHPVIRHYFGGEMQEFHFGDSLLARWDRPHGEGGAVMSYHYEFQKWLESMLGLDFELPDPIEGGPYRAWSDEELQAWHDMEAMKKEMMMEQAKLAAPVVHPMQ
ncbi:MAG: SidA/IucD/PvdA family monooxygenase [Candidatus Hydrogenedens sp.]|nr:SidA/IucD/PvdA family monooxygenase [Candidatus Hydrogenedens sp.]